MTDKRMALVPREADSGMVIAGVEQSNSRDELMYSGVYRAMTSAAPNGGKVSREQFLEAVYANCSVASAFGCGCACIGVPPCEWHIEQTRAVIAALGLEIE